MHPAAGDTLRHPRGQHRRRPDRGAAARGSTGDLAALLRLQDVQGATIPVDQNTPQPRTVAALTVTEALDALDPPVVAADPVAAGAAALVAGGVDVLLDEPQAAKRMEAPATAAIGQVKACSRLERAGEVMWASKQTGSKAV